MAGCRRNGRSGSAAARALTMHPVLRAVAAALAPVPRRPPPPWGARPPAEVGAAETVAARGHRPGWKKGAIFPGQVESDSEKNFTKE